MNRIVLAAILAAAIVSGAFARGAGGVELPMNIGADVLPFLGYLDSNPYWLVADTAKVIGFGGYGYGITRSGLKIGGFGFVLSSGQMEHPLPELGIDLHSLNILFMGLIWGSQVRYNDWVIDFDTRFGMGLIEVNYGENAEATPISGLSMTPSAYASFDLGIGFLVTPFMLVSAYIAIEGTLTYTGEYSGLLPMALPVAGLRVAWGKF